jgi:hypothetical protein
MSDELVFDLSALKPAEVEIQIEMGYGRTVKIPGVLPTVSQWENEGRQIVDPKVPLTLSDPNNAEKLLPNRTDQAYLDKLTVQQRRRLAYRLACFIERSGRVVPGDSAVAKADELLKMENGIFNALAKEVMRYSVDAERARVQSLAATFPPEPNVEADDEGDDTLEHQNGSGVGIVTASGAG